MASVQDKALAVNAMGDHRDFVVPGQKKSGYGSESSVLEFARGDQNKYKRLTQSEGDQFEKKIEYPPVDPETLDAHGKLFHLKTTNMEEHRYTEQEVKEQPWYFNLESASCQVKIFKWLVPFLLCMFANLAMSFLLHVGTYYYIQVMNRFELAYKEKRSFDSDSYFKHHPLSPGLKNTSKSFGSLEDPIEGRLGWQKLSVQELDMAALVLPFLWFLLVAYQRDLQIWTKTLLCHSMLAFFKGVIAAVTVIPDSIGWEACKARLGETALNTMAHTIPDPLRNSTAFWSATSKIVAMEWAGYTSGHPVRFCADMMYSGHTFVTCLYGFALVELTRKTFIDSPRRLKIVYCVSIFFGLEQMFEIERVLKNRFHYLMDIIVAILMVMLWFTNGAVIITASRWSKLGEDAATAPPVKKGFSKGMRDYVLEGLNPNRTYELIETATMKKKNMERAMELNVAVIDTTLRNKQLPIGFQMCAHRLGLGLLARNNVARRDGDLWIPPACCPFSQFYGGRFSILANNTIERYDPVLPSDLLEYGQVSPPDKSA